MRVVRHFVLWSLGLAAPETQTSEAERDCLARHARGKRRVVEIGVWHGVTTVRLRAAMAPDGVLYAVDPFPRGRLGFSVQRVIAQRVVGRESNGTVRWIRLTGAAAGQRHASAGEPSVDFLFVDGDHSYEAIRADWEAWNRLIEPGGIIALHDSHPTDERLIQDAGSVRFTREQILTDARFARVDLVDSLTVLRRVGGRS